MLPLEVVGLANHKLLLSYEACLLVNSNTLVLPSFVCLRFEKTLVLLLRVGPILFEANHLFALRGSSSMLVLGGQSLVIKSYFLRP